MPDDPEVKTTIRLPKSLLRAAKVYAAQHDTTLNAVIIHALARLTKGGT